MPQYRAAEYWPDGLPGMTIVRTVEGVERMERQLAGQRRLIFDLETSGIAWYRHARAVGSAFAAWDGDGRIHCWYLPYRHQTGEPQVSADVALSSTRYLLSRAGTVISHNIKFDEHFSVLEGWEIGDDRYDTMIAGALFNENVPLKLETRAERHLGVVNSLEWNGKVQVELMGLAKTAGMKKKAYLDRYGYSQVPINLLGIYACHDVLYTGGLYDFFETRHSVSKTYPRIWPTEMKLTRILGEMERNGLPIDIGYLESLRDALSIARAGFGHQIAAELGTTFRPSADDDVRTLLYEHYKLPIIKWTKGRKPSVDSDVLKYYAHRLPVLKVLQSWRDADKLLNTYTSSIIKRTDAMGLCHTDFQQVGTNTGRMSSKEPNFQNQPTDDPERKKKHGGVDPWSIRRAFIVRKDGVRVMPRLFFDYSQVELRMLGHFTGDPIMHDVFLSGGDIHARTQEEVGFVLGRKVERRKAKIVNFGLSYCLTAMGLSRQADMNLEDAERFLEAFEQRYAGIPVFRQRFWAQIRAQPGHWFSNLWGRRRRLPLMSSFKGWERRRAERQAIGTLIQGQAAELTKESLVRVDALIKERQLPVKLCNVVHDDIQMDSRADAIAEVCPAVKTEMERYPEFYPIPIKVDGDYSITNWAEKISLPLAA